MFREKDLCSSVGQGGDLKQDLGQNHGNPDEKIRFCVKGLDFMGKSGMNCDGSESNPKKNRNSSSHELTFGYLCDSSKLGFSERESLKGKEIVMENLSQEERLVERDLLQLNEIKGGFAKRESDEENERDGESSKKPKLETLKLSLALPDVSLSLTASNVAPNCDGVVQPKPTRSVQPLARSDNNTRTTCSNNFTMASLSSYSHPFSHNPSCSLTRNSTENYDYSVGRETDQIWHCGEGTNGSVHSRFKPIGDGVGLSNHGGGLGYALANGGRPFSKESSLYRVSDSDNTSFFPSELPARPKMETVSGDSKGRSLDHAKGLDGLEGWSTSKLSMSEKIIREIITESIPVMSQMLQEIPDETVESAKQYLRTIITAPQRKDELAYLQNRLNQRADLTKETLLKSHKSQLEIIVAVKFGLAEFVSGKICVETAELVEIFLYMRCRNINCKALLPIEDCDCKICSTEKGFCSQCMCPVCLKFDCANNTCSWVGCDACSHWCHASCGIEKALIKPGPKSKGSSGATEMQFHCLGCGHASEMFGFVKEVFMCCAKDWGLETLLKELDCVRKIFKGSEDVKGIELYLKAAETITRLERRAMSPADACNVISQFFNNKDITSDLSASRVAPKDTIPLSSSNPLAQKSSMFGVSPSGGLRNYLPYDHHSTTKPALRDDFLSGKLAKLDGFDSLESIVRVKEAEARMFQNRSDEAQKEAETYRELVRAKTEKLEEEYAEKLAKLCLNETKERRRKKMEELKMIESSHCDYFNMKMRMQAEIAGLLERMEATRKQWV